MTILMMIIDHDDSYDDHENSYDDHDNSYDDRDDSDSDDDSYDDHDYYNDNDWKSIVKVVQWVMIVIPIITIK